MDAAKRRVLPPPGIRISPPPGLPSTKRHPPACRQGAVPELKPLELGEGREEPGEARGALWADAVIPAGGAWGKPRSGQAWQLGASLAGKPCSRQSSQRPLAVLDFVHLRVTQIIVYYKNENLRLSYLEKD